jgi:hypothetical protein
MFNLIFGQQFVKVFIDVEFLGESSGSKFVIAGECYRLNIICF